MIADLIQPILAFTGLSILELGIGILIIITILRS